MLASIRAKSTHSFLGWSPVMRVPMLTLCLCSPLLLIRHLLEDSETHTHTHTSLRFTLIKLVCKYFVFLTFRSQDHEVVPTFFCSNASSLPALFLTYSGQTQTWLLCLCCLWHSESWNTKHVRNQTITEKVLY